MKLSIIVPVYNMAAEGKLNFCLDSLLNQGIDDYEIIAVDDKSTDDSLEILKHYEEKYPNIIKVIASPENRKQGGAKNLGLRKATGEWLSFIDSDDWIAPDFYRKLFAEAERTGADIVGCNYCLTSEHNFEVGQIIKSNRKEQTGKMSPEKYAKLILEPGSMVTKIYKRRIFYDNGIWFPEYVFYEDNCAGILTMLYCENFAYLDEPLYYYYQHTVSTVHHLSVEKCYHRMQTMEYLMEECYKRGFLEEYPNELEYRFTELFYVNTLFTYMIGVPFFKKKISFLRLLKQGITTYFPDFAANPYFLKKQEEEVKKLATMNVKSPVKFFWYYTALSTYRKLRKKLGK